MAEEATDERTSQVNVLIIRTGGIGAFVQALGAFAAIRMHHSGANIVLLTDGGMTNFSCAAPYFDSVEAEPGSMSGWRSVVRDRAWDVVYDLDTSARTARIYRSTQTWRQRFGLDAPVKWCGIAKGCALPHLNPQRLAMHAGDRMMDQLFQA